MIRLLLFFKKIYVVLLFAGLEIVCLSMFLQSNPYQRAGAVAMSNGVVGALHEQISGVSNYFQLSDQNAVLMAENARLRSELFTYKSLDTLSGSRANFMVDSLPVYVVNVVRNTISARDNFITINSGTRHGIEPDMALFNSDGIVGYVLYCSENFAVATSVLNHSIFRTSGKIKNTDFMGAISWGGDNYREVNFDEVPKYSDIKVGDTILSTSSSNIFPPDLPIGVVASFELINGTFYTAKLTLLADHSRLTQLYAVKLRGRDEREALEQKIETTPNI